MSAGIYGGQGTDAAFGVGSVNGDRGRHRGSALALLPFEAIYHLCADGNDQRRVLVPFDVWPLSRTSAQTGCALPASAGGRGIVRSDNLEGGAQ